MEVSGDSSFFVGLHRKRMFATGWLAKHPGNTVRVYGELLSGTSDPDLFALIGGE